MSRERPAAAGTSRPPAGWFAPAGTCTWPPTTSASWRCFPRRATRRGASSASCPESCRPIPRNASATSPMSRRSHSCRRARSRGALLALESGSKPNRRGGVLWDLDADGALTGDPRRLDLAALYAVLEADIPDLNIEGATVAGDRLLLFQRGNGRAGVNAVIGLELRGAAVPPGRASCRRRADRHPPPRPRRGGRRAPVLLRCHRGRRRRRAVLGRRRSRRGHLSRRTVRRRRGRDAAPGREARVDQPARPAGEGRGHRGPPCGHGAGSADGRGPDDPATPRRCSPRASRCSVAP